MTQKLNYGTSLNPSDTNAAPGMPLSVFSPQAECS